MSDEFRAVFARKDNSTIAESGYTGSALAALTAVNLSRNNLFIGNATLESYGGITAEVIGFGAEHNADQPVAIGAHDVRVKLFTDNTEGGVRTELVSEIVLPFEIVYANLYANLSTTASSGYNSATGWASRMAFDVSGIPTASADYGYKYIYTLETDGEVKAENRVVDWNGSNVFETPTVYEGVDISAKSAVITFRLVVTHDVDGVPTADVEMNAVALSEPFTVKLDNTPVTISAFRPTAALGTGWLQSAQFTAEVTFGGSGYDLSYGIKSKSGNSLSATNRALLTADEVNVISISGADNSGYLYGADSGNVTAARSFTVSKELYRQLYRRYRPYRRTRVGRQKRIEAGDQRIFCHSGTYRVRFRRRFGAANNAGARIRRRRGRRRLVRRGSHVDFDNHR